MATGVRAGAVAAVLGLGLALAACSGTPDGDDPPESPLTAFLGVSTQRSQLGPPLLTEGERQRQLAMEELIADCMADQGFEYVPVSPEQRMAGTFASAYELAPADFAEQYGYGVTTLRGATGGEQPADPNHEIRDALPADERDEYERALWGEEGDGCQLRASTAVYGDPSELDDGFAQFQDLLDQIGELYRQIESDPRLQEAATGWAACLAEAGYPDFATPDDARQSVFDRLSAVQGAGQTTPDPAALAEIGDYERALAPVDLACQRDHVEEPRQELTAEREQEFVDQHRADLERYRDWLAQTRDGTG